MMFPVGLCPACDWWLRSQAKLCTWHRPRAARPGEPRWRHRCSKIPWLLGRPWALQAKLYCISFRWPQGSPRATHDTSFLPSAPRTCGTAGSWRTATPLTRSRAFCSVWCCLDSWCIYDVHAVSRLPYVRASESCSAAKEYMLLLLLLFLRFFFF